MTLAEIYEKEYKKVNPFMGYNHIFAELIEEDHAIVRHEIQSESINPYGFVHGGLFCAMADNVTGMASHTDGRTYVSQHCSIDFISNQKEGTIFAEAWVKHRGHKTVLVDFEITGTNKKVLASGRYTMFCVGE